MTHHKGFRKRPYEPPMITKRQLDPIVIPRDNDTVDVKNRVKGELLFTLTCDQSIAEAEPKCLYYVQRDAKSAGKPALYYLIEAWPQLDVWKVSPIIPLIVIGT